MRSSSCGFVQEGPVISKLIARIRHAWSIAPVATAVLAVALVACLFFGARAAVFWYDRPPLAVLEQPVQAWMTPRYVSRTWRIPPELVSEALSAPRPPPDGPMSLRDLAEYRGVTVEQVLAEAEALVASHRPSHEDGEVAR